MAAGLARLLRAHGHSEVVATVAYGRNSADPHHRSGERTLKKGDMVVLDFGGLKDGYSSRMTRTVHVGEPTEEERTVHDVVVTVQSAAFEAMAPGVTCREVDRWAREPIEAAGYGQYVSKRTGYGIRGRPTRAAIHQQER